MTKHASMSDELEKVALIGQILGGLASFGISSAVGAGAKRLAIQAPRMIRAGMKSGVIGKNIGQAAMKATRSPMGRLARKGVGMAGSALPWVWSPSFGGGEGGQSQPAQQAVDTGLRPA
jgi:hypothetical protein